MTIKVKNIIPALAIHPGETLKDELDAREISQTDFANDIGISPTQLNEIIKGKRNITADFALLLEKALGIKAEFWMNLQTSYELDVSRIKEKNIQKFSQVERWNTIKLYVPISYYKKQGLLSDNLEENENKVKEIYNESTIDGIINATSKPCYARFKKSSALAGNIGNIVGWQKLVEWRAKKVIVEPFSIKQKNELIDELKKISTKKNLVSNTVKLLSRYGIILIVQEKPDKAPIDGMAFWTNDNPAIGVTLRHNRVDNFIFTIMHELGHIYLHLYKNRKKEFIENLDDHTYMSKTPEENEANEFASNNLIPTDKWEEFRMNHFNIDDDDIIKFANELKINPATVRGRLCHEDHNYYMKRTIIPNKLS